MGFALRQIGQQLQDLGVAQRVSDALRVQRLRQRRWRGIDRLPVSALNRLRQQAIELLRDVWRMRESAPIASGTASLRLKPPLVGGPETPWRRSAASAERALSR